jgi:hypothetical protein
VLEFLLNKNRKKELKNPFLSSLPEGSMWIDPIVSDSSSSASASVSSSSSSSHRVSFPDSIPISQPHTQEFITTTMSFSIDLAHDALISDYIFGDKEQVPVEYAQKRIDRLRIKHPEYFEPLKRMEEKAYHLNK